MDHEGKIEELLDLSDEALVVAGEALEACRVQIPLSNLRDLNVLFNNALKAHKMIIDHILSLERESSNVPHIDLNEYELEL